MNFKNAIAISALAVVAVLAITSFSGFETPEIDAQTVATQPEKFVYVENVATTAVFKFRDGTEIVPVQLFTQTAGFGTTTLKGVDDPRTPSSVTGRAKPTFTMEKSVSVTSPHLYKAADEAQKYIMNAGFEYPYKRFGVEVILAKGGDVLRSFDYRDCVITNYAVTTRIDNEEGYTGKGIAIVDQFTFECDGYTPLNPAMDKMKVSQKAKSVSTNDLRSTDTWDPGFKK